VKAFKERLTEKQQEAFDVLRANERVLLYGGARSGKTLLITCAILIRAMRYPGSRHLIARLRYSHARASLWHDTLPDALKFLGIYSYIKWHDMDRYITIPNRNKEPSEIWVDGLDDKERVDRILGREYATIFLNEVSQIGYRTVTTVLTRLAQNVPGCEPKLFLDENPPSKFHWTYRLFLQGIDPETGENTDIDNYAALQINPAHNIENLPPGYIKNNLDKLPPHKRRRFLLGEFGDAEGVIFTNWDIVEGISDDIKRHSRLSYGLDFGFSVDPATLIEVRMNGDDIYLNELIYETGLTNQALAARINDIGIKDIIIADASEPKSIKELQQAGLNIRPATKGPDSVRQGIDWLSSKRLHITRNSLSIQAELENYCWKENREGKAMPEPIDDYNHAIDAVRYAVEPWKAAKSVFIGRARGSSRE